MKLGLTLLRVVIGALFFGHGTQKLFGWFGGHGIEGTAGFFESLGLKPGRRHATAAGAAEAGGGALVALGFLTPAAAAVADRRDVDRDREGAHEEWPLGQQGRL